MTIKELKDELKGKYVEMEVYRDKFNPKDGFHTDRIECVPEGDYSEDQKVLEWELMDEYDYNMSVMANDINYMDFNDVYSDECALILCVKIAREDLQWE